MAIIIYEVIHHVQLLISPERTRDTFLGEATLTALQLAEPLQHVVTVAANGSSGGFAVYYVGTRYIGRMATTNTTTLILKIL